MAEYRGSRDPIAATDMEVELRITVMANPEFMAMLHQALDAQTAVQVTFGLAAEKTVTGVFTGAVPTGEGVHRISVNIADSAHVGEVRNVYGDVKGDLNL